MSSPIQSESDWHITETYKGLITLGVETLKIIFVLNGGALVACLTFLGNQAIKLVKKPPLPIPEMLQFYLLGLSLTALAFLVAYFMQLRLYGEEIRRREGQSVVRVHGHLINVAGILLVAAVVSFCVGSWFATQVLSGLVGS